MIDANGNVKIPGWETVRLIGRGSFGAVYEIQRDVFGDVEKNALKHISIPQNDNEIRAMKSEGQTAESITQTFADQAKDIVSEYKMLAKLNNCPNVVTCHDVSFVQKDSGYGWDIFIRMELLKPFEDYLAEHFTIPESEILKLGKDICNALIACRRRNIVHRDIKPQNIFLSEDDKYKLGDFGIARISEATSSATVRVGTYAYMAPEVYNGEHYGAGADIYSLGMVLYWLLNNRKAPFVSVNTEREKTAGLHRRMGGEQIPAPVNGSKALRQIVLKACAFDPKERYQSPQEMLDALKGIGPAVDNEVGEAPVVALPADHSEQPVEDEGTVDAFSRKREEEKAGEQIDEAAEQNIPASLRTSDSDDGTVGVFGWKRSKESVESEDIKEDKENEEASESVGTSKSDVPSDANAPSDTDVRSDSIDVYKEHGKKKRKPKPILWIALGLVVLLAVIGFFVISRCGSVSPKYASLETADVGDYVRFGQYEQDNNTSNGKENIEWLVLEKSGSKLLLISRYALDCQPYNEIRTEVQWETCSLREWLNGTFLNNAFNAEEKQMIQYAEVDTTSDKVFLLSITEVNRYLFLKDASKCVPTDHAIALGVNTNTKYAVGDKATCWWWLRSTDNSEVAAVGSTDGSALSYGSHVHLRNGAVRPALWIDLEP